MGSNTDTVDMTPSAGRRSTRISTWIPVSLVVLLASVGALYWTVLKDDRPRVKGGTVVVAPLDTVHGSTADVYVPWGRFRLTIGTPTEELPEGLRDGQRAPEDGRFVGLSLEIGQVDSLLPMAFTKYGGYREPQVTLVADGEPHPVPQLTEWIVRRGGNLRVAFSRDVFVAIDSMPTTLWVEVSYDGATQTVSSSGNVTPGRFASLRHTSIDNEPIPCGKAQGPPQRKSAAESASCTVTRAGRLPYVAGLGWADKGREWLVLLTEIGEPDAEVDSEYTTTTYSIAGQHPASQVKANDTGPPLTFADPDDPDQVVFAVPKDAQDLRLDITSTFRAREHASGIQLSWHVDLA